MLSANKSDSQTRLTTNDVVYISAALIQRDERKLRTTVQLAHNSPALSVIYDGCGDGDIVEAFRKAQASFLPSAGRNMDSGCS
jgi:hypothetical protein